MVEFWFKYYVLNYDFNRKKVVQFNIFDNIHVQEWTEKAIKKYLRSPSKYEYKYNYICKLEPLYGFEALCKEIDGILRWQEWGRCEYEIAVGSIFNDDVGCFEKWDCYMQCKENIGAITRECIWQYKQYLKERKENKDDR